MRPETFLGRPGSGANIGAGATIEYSQLSFLFGTATNTGDNGYMVAHKTASNDNFVTTEDILADIPFDDEDDPSGVGASPVLHLGAGKVEIPSGAASWGVPSDMQWWAWKIGIGSSIQSEFDFENFPYQLSLWATTNNFGTPTEPIAWAIGITEGVPAPGFNGIVAGFSYLPGDPDPYRSIMSIDDAAWTETPLATDEYHQVLQGVIMPGGSNMFCNNVINDSTFIAIDTQIANSLTAFTDPHFCFFVGRRNVTSLLTRIRVGTLLRAIGMGDI